MKRYKNMVPHFPMYTRILIEKDGDDECTGCDSFAHDVSFTHDAIMDISPAVAMPPRDFDLCKYTKHELAYLHGLDAPNYPMPCTQTHARSIQPDKWLDDLCYAFEFMRG